MANNLLLDMLNLTIYDMLCFAQSVPRTYVEFVTFLMFYSIGDLRCLAFSFFAHSQTTLYERVTFKYINQDNYKI